MELGRLRAQLRAAIEPHAEVELALLFGSRSRGVAGPGSDVDVAVVGRAVDALGLGVELTDATGLSVDIVDISGDPPIALVLEVLRDGINVYEMPGAYGRFLSRTLTMLETDLPAYRLMQRAFLQRVAEHGLMGAENSSIRGEIVQSMLARLDEHVARVRAHGHTDPKQLESDHDAADLIAFNLLLAIQVACDLAAHLIAGHGWNPPATIAGGFHKLAEHRVISPATASALQRLVSVRDDIWSGLATKAATEHGATTALDNLDRFGTEVAVWYVASGSAASARPRRSDR